MPTFGSGAIACATGTRNEVGATGTITLSTTGAEKIAHIVSINATPSVVAPSNLFLTGNL